jgi:gamma-glutamylcysteine synthetase
MMYRHLHRAGEPRLRLRGDMVRSSRGAGAAAGRPRRSSPPRPSSRAAQRARSWRSRIWRGSTTRARGCCPSRFRRGWGSSATWTGCSMCPCTSSTATGATSTPGAVVPRLHGGAAPGAAGRGADAVGLGGPLTTVFPEARVKQFIEMRGRRHGRPRACAGAAAFWTGFFMTPARSTRPGTS